MRKRGYTLIEVLIVVAILAILTLGAITALSGQRRRAEDAKMKADLDRLRIAFEDYYNDHNCYPPVAWFATATSCGSNLMAPYLQAIACDPHTGLPYQVQVDQTGCKWFRFSANLGTPEIQPGCTSGASCPLVATYSVGSGNIDPYAIPSPSPSGTPLPPLLLPLLLPLLRVPASATSTIIAPGSATALATTQPASTVPLATPTTPSATPRAARAWGAVHRFKFPLY